MKTRSTNGFVICDKGEPRRRRADDGRTYTWTFRITEMETINAFTKEGFVFDADRVMVRPAKLVVSFKE